MSAPTGVVQNPLTPTTPVLDNFNRPNGGAGSNWSLMRPSGYVAMNVLNNNAVDASSSAWAWNYWNPATFGPNCEAYVTLVSYNPAYLMRMGCRVTGVGTTSYSGYFISISPTGAWSIIRVDAGSDPVTLASVSRPPASGDKIAIRIVGSVVSGLRWTSVAGWTTVVSYDTSSDAIRYTAPGRLTLLFRGSTLDDFGGGSLP